MSLQTATTTSRDGIPIIYYWALQPAESQYTGYLLNGISSWNDYAQAPDTGPADDTFNGSDKDDRLFASVGDDTVDGGTDDDWVIGGDGDNSLSGSDGNDTLYGDYVNTHLVTVGSNGAAPVGRCRACPTTASSATTCSTAATVPTR